jgi:hypothetical protein
MRRSALAASVVLTCAAVVSSLGAASASAAQAPATAGAACSTAQTIQISNLSFQPPAVHPGQFSTATATAVNCTAHTQQAVVQWYGRFIGATGTTFPAGCPVLDPVSFSLTLAPFATASSSLGYSVPASCTANGLVVTVTVAQQGKVVAQRSAELIIEQ